MSKTNTLLFLLVACMYVGSTDQLHAQDHSIVRKWNERTLAAIRRDFARPPVQARNLYHISAAMYEAWAAYDPHSEPFLLGRTRAGYVCPYDGVAVPQQVEEARAEAISFAAYRLISHRFQNSPGVFPTMLEINALMDEQGYDRTNISQDYLSGGPAELGNYIAAQILAYGMQDGSHEQFNFSNQYYSPINTPLIVADGGNAGMADPNRWQQMTLALTIDQQGNPVPSTPPFQSPEWGNVDPFGLVPDQMTSNVRDGHTYKVYLDPGAPAYLDTNELSGLESFYKWNFCMVPIWQSHLDPADETMIDISPAAKGNIQSYPQSEQEIRDFYDYFDGGDPGTGYTINPVTGEPYTPQVVKRGDYARILAEFWADGPNSETPPGHWFSIMHSVMDHPLFERRWSGEGEVLDAMEYDVKAHLVLGGALHDAAITAWGIKGWYDYVRPISAIRYMASKGQCSDPLLPNHHPAGLPLIPGYMEMVEIGDPLAGDSAEHVGKVKLYTWRGPEHIEDPEVDVAGVGWVLAENWYPYQRPTFVTPPFAGYISGHSTFSRTAAEVLTSITGSPFFPGGMSNFTAPQNEFLVFEQGPSEDIHLQWATYRDASDQCSLSRIWGGIHPAVDDIPGRLLGMVIGPQAVEYGDALFASQRPLITSVTANEPILNIGLIGEEVTVDIAFDVAMDEDVHPNIEMLVDDPLQEALDFVDREWISANTYRLTFTMLASSITLDNIHMRVDSARALDGTMQNVYLAVRPFSIDTEEPLVNAVDLSTNLVNNDAVEVGTLEVIISFNEACDPATVPEIAWNAIEDLSATLVLDEQGSEWIEPHLFKAVFQLIDNDEEIDLFGMHVTGVLDAAGNIQLEHIQNDLLVIDTREPNPLAVTLNTELLNTASIGAEALVIELVFDEEMNTMIQPEIWFINGDPLANSLLADADNSAWLDQSTYRQSYFLLDASEEFADLTVTYGGAVDMAGNLATLPQQPPTYTLDTRVPEMLSAAPSVAMVADAHAGTGTFMVMLQYSEPMDEVIHPSIELISDEDISGSLLYEPTLSAWSDATTFEALFTVVDEGLEIPTIGLLAANAVDHAGNLQPAATQTGVFALDTRNPELLLLSASTYAITDSHVGPEGLQLVAVFDEAMEQGNSPTLLFSEDVSMALLLNAESTSWLNPSTHRTIFDVQNTIADMPNLDVTLSMATDLAGNQVVGGIYEDFLSVNITQVGIEEFTQGSFHIYPNPCVPGTTVWLDMHHVRIAPLVQLLDANGRLVLQEQFTGDPGIHGLQLPSLANGTYMLVITADGATTRSRLVILDH